MASTLLAVAEKAQDVAAALEKFLDPVHDQSAEITALMAECLSTSSALRELDRKIGDFPYHRRYPDISAHLTTVKSSLTYTIRDVERLFGGVGRVAVVPRAEYGYVWDDLCDFFRAESGNTLRRRLEIYCTILEELSDTLIEGLPRDPDLFDELVIKVEKLLDAQDDSFARAFDGIGLGDPVVNRPNSFERRRPQGQNVPQPRREPQPDPRGGGRGDHRHPDMEHDFGRGAHRPPPAPDIPRSPTTSNTFSTHSSSINSVLSSHWLPEVFRQSRPATLLGDTGQTSASLAHAMPGSSTRLEENGYVNVVELPFENGDLLVRLYWRSHDCRSRFLCRTIRPARSRKDVVLPLVSLIVSRSGPFLEFKDVGEGNPKLWACLKFSSYELMVLFFCTFLALRSEDLKMPWKTIKDYDVHKEKELFAGRIVDDRYEHALRLFQEKDTGVVRLQASAQTGTLKRKPIWTAFVTHQIISPTWMSRDTPGVVHLADLQRYVFTEEYTPQRTPTGAHELTFILPTDAKDFVKAVKKLAKSLLDRRGH
ncbi:hypothetical protein HO173_002906 [Letharia columbiana]|uniref:Uncharacterized protein n=1 Tax=Letharia columbiana TaxID=112416 RepID=A0A8H6G220_9LECA|nr:uncharacterized protein HO173_002906 [Letharia columbiana]KAF6239034.1 hypothetical protein HO173_002906 [Letharia columbiana]